MVAQQPAVPTMATATTDAERDAAAAHFWATATTAQILGFTTNAETLANNLANETRNRSLSEPLVNTPFFLEVHRPLEADENPLHPEMWGPRARAVVGGFVQRVEDVGRPKVRWEDPVSEGMKGGKGSQPVSNTQKKREWYRSHVLNDKRHPSRGGFGRDNNAPPRGGREARDVGRAQQPPSSQRLLDQAPPGLPFLGQQLLADGRPDWGDFGDTDDFFRKQARKFNPEAVVFESTKYCKPGGGFNPSRPKDEPDDEMGGGLGAPEQVV
jgi:hypothetical protein